MSRVLPASLAACCALLVAGLAFLWLSTPPSPSGGVTAVPSGLEAAPRPAFDAAPTTARSRSVPPPERSAPALSPEAPAGLDDREVVDEPASGRVAGLEVPGSAAVVNGYLRGPAGEPVAGRAVFFHSPSLDRRFRVVTQESGAFAIEGVAPGDDYVLSVYAAGGLAALEEGPLAVGPGGLRRELYLEPAATGVLEGWLVDDSGAPATLGFDLWLRSPGSRELRPVRADSAGFFRLEKVPVGDVVLESRGPPRFTARGIRVPAGGVETVTLRLGSGPHALSGSVVGEDGRPVASAEVRLHWAHRGNGVRSAAFRSAVSDGLGRFIFSELGAGLHDLDVSASGFQSVRVSHEAGRDPVTISRSGPATPRRSPRGRGPGAGSASTAGPRTITPPRSRPRRNPVPSTSRALVAAGKAHVDEALAGIDEGPARLGNVVSLQLYALELELELERWDAALGRLETCARGATRQESWLAREGSILESAGRAEDARRAYREALAAIGAVPARRRGTRALARLEGEVRAALERLEGGDQAVVSGGR
jgi:hypothetical protein